MAAATCGWVAKRVQVLGELSLNRIDAQRIKQNKTLFYFFFISIYLLFIFLF